MSVSRFTVAVMIRKLEKEVGLQLFVRGRGYFGLTPAGPRAKSRESMREVRVGADKVDYLANATVVHSTAQTGLVAKTDGIYGIRVNHSLEVPIDGFGMSRP